MTILPSPICGKWRLCIEHESSYSSIATKYVLMPASRIRLSTCVCFCQGTKCTSSILWWYHISAATIIFPFSLITVRSLSSFTVSLNFGSKSLSWEQLFTFSLETDLSWFAKQPCSFASQLVVDKSLFLSIFRIQFSFLLTFNNELITGRAPPCCISIPWSTSIPRMLETLVLSRVQAADSLKYSLSHSTLLQHSHFSVWYNNQENHLQSWSDSTCKF